MNTVMAATGFLTGYIVPFILVLSLLVFVHEMGHYLVGRWSAAAASHMRLPSRLQVGRGKSSLVHALLGDLHKVQGRVVIYGSVAVSPQQPWLRMSRPTCWIKLNDAAGKLCTSKG